MGMVGPKSTRLPAGSHALRHQQPRSHKESPHIPLLSIRMQQIRGQGKLHDRCNGQSWRHPNSTAPPHNLTLMRYIFRVAIWTSLTLAQHGWLSCPCCQVAGAQIFIAGALQPHGGQKYLYRQLNSSSTSTDLLDFQGDASHNITILCCALQYKKTTSSFVPQVD